MIDKQAIELSDNRPGFYSQVCIEPKSTGSPHRFEPSDQDGTAHQIQNGDSTSSSCSRPRRVDGVNQFERSLFSGPDPQETKKVPQICVGRSRLPLQGSLFYNTLQVFTRILSSVATLCHPLYNSLQMFPPNDGELTYYIWRPQDYGHQNRPLCTSTLGLL